MNTVNQSISAGLGGFLALFLLALSLWMLMRSMLRHLRTTDLHDFPAEENPVAGSMRSRPAAPAARTVDSRDNRDGDRQSGGATPTAG